jgi:hypothetical protein
VLIDGFVHATWTITRDRDSATISIQPMQPIATQQREELVEEGSRLLTFMEPEGKAMTVQVMEAG